MKPWQINLIAILGVILIAIFVPSPYAKSVIVLIVFGSGVWAYFDAKKLDVGKYQTKGFLAPGSTPGSIFAVVWLLWIIGFPLYISYRQKIIDGKIPLKNIGIPTPPAINA